MMNHHAGCRRLALSLELAALGRNRNRYLASRKPKPSAQAEFENEAALMGALGSNEGKAVAGDVPNYASGGVTMMHFAVG